MGRAMLEARWWAQKLHWVWLEVRPSSTWGSSPGAGQAPVRWVPSVCQGAVPPQVPMAPFCTRSDVDAAPVLCGAVRLSTPC